MSKSKIQSITPFVQNASGWRSSKCTFESGESGSLFVKTEEETKKFAVGSEHEFEVKVNGEYTNIVIKQARAGFGGGMAANNSQAKALIAIAAYDRAASKLDSGVIQPSDFISTAEKAAKIISDIYKSINL